MTRPDPNPAPPASPSPGPDVPTAGGRDGGTDPAAPSGGGGLAAAVALYALARLGLLALIAGLLVLAGTPLVIAVLVALVVALPLSMLLFRGLRARLDGALAVARERRGAQREALRAGLRGEGEVPGEVSDDVRRAGSGDRSEGQADGGRGGPHEQQDARLGEHPDQASAVSAAEHPPGDGGGQR
jgi:membrane protein implicated in regulation of membrane protease activity